jgi:hypothetical protein
MARVGARAGTPGVERVWGRCASDNITIDLADKGLPAAPPPMAPGHHPWWVRAWPRRSVRAWMLMSPLAPPFTGPREDRAPLIYLADSHAAGSTKRGRNSGGGGGGGDGGGGSGGKGPGGGAALPSDEAPEKGLTSAAAAAAAEAVAATRPGAVQQGSSASGLSRRATGLSRGASGGSLPGGAASEGAERGHLVQGQQPWREEARLPPGEGGSKQA